MRAVSSVPVVIFAASRSGMRAVSSVPLVILEAAKLGMSEATRTRQLGEPEAFEGVANTQLAEIDPPKLMANVPLLVMLDGLTLNPVGTVIPTLVTDPGVTDEFTHFVPLYLSTCPFTYCFSLYNSPLEFLKLGLLL